MNKIKKILISTILTASVGTAFSLPCDNFEINISNNLLYQFYVSKIIIQGASLQSYMPTVGSKSSASFTINNTNKYTNIVGELVLQAIDPPNRMVRINFGFENQHMHCHQFEKTAYGDYQISRSRSLGKVTYTIG